MPVHVFKHSSRSLMMLRQRVGLLLILCLALLLTPLHATERTASHLASSLQSLSTSRQGIWSRVFGSENQTLTSQQATQLGQAWENAPLHVFRDSAGYFDAALHGLVLDSIWDTAPSAFTPSSSMQQGFDYQILKQRWNGRDEQRFTLPMPLFPINSSKLIYPLHTKHSLYLNRLNYRSAPVAAVADSFTNILGYPCSISYIRTPAWSFEGRGPHFHSHSTFILQLRGRQNASVHMESTVFQHGSHHHEVPHMLHQPFLHDQSLKAFAAPFAFHATATRSFHLRPGSVLYVPSGFVHSLSTQPIETALPPMLSPDDSEHLEIGVEIDAAFTVTGFLHALIEQVKASVSSELSAPYSCEPPRRQLFDATDGVEWRWSHIVHFLLDEVAHRTPNVMLRRTLTFFTSNQPKHGSNAMPSWFDSNVRQTVSNAIDIFVNSASIEHLLHSHDAPLCRIMSQSDLFQAPQGVSSRQYMSNTKRALHCPRFKPASPLQHAKLHRSPHNVHDDEGFAELRYGSWHPRLQQWFDLPSEAQVDDEDYRVDRVESEPSFDIYSDSDAGDLPPLTSRAQQALDIVAARELSELKLHEHEHSFEFSHTHIMNRIKSLELRLRADPAFADQYLPKDDSHPHYQEGFVHPHDYVMPDEPVWRHLLRDILPLSVSEFLQLNQPYQPLPSKPELIRDSQHTIQTSQRTKPATSRMIRLHSLIGQCIRQRSTQSAEFIVQQTLNQLKIALLDESALAAAARDIEKLAAQTRLEYYRQRDATLKQHELAKRSWKAPERTPHEEVELIRQKARADALNSMNNNRLKTEL